MHHLPPKENLFEECFMILGLVIILPFIFAYKALKFLGE